MKHAFAAMLISIATANAEAAELIVHIDRIATDRGDIRVAVYDNEAAYRNDNETKAVRRAKTAARKPTVTLTFPDLPVGKYAIKAFHDENGDGLLNRSFFGAPTEPYGISNNVRARFSLLPFDKALVEVKQSLTEIHIDLAGQAGK